MGIRKDNGVTSHRKYFCPHVIFKNIWEALLQSHFMAPGDPGPLGCFTKFNPDCSPPKKSHCFPYEDSPLGIVSNGKKYLIEDLKVSCQLPFLALVSC